MIIAISKFTIANDMIDEVKVAFINRPHLVDSTPGFLGIEIMNSIDNSSEVCLVTRWKDEQSYHNWHRGHEYQDSHQGIPKGLKLVPGSNRIQLFDVFAD
jgi:heme-degrading monooxygenase HmoA